MKPVWVNFLMLGCAMLVAGSIGWRLGHDRGVPDGRGQAINWLRGMKGPVVLATNRNQLQAGITLLKDGGTIALPGGLYFDRSDSVIMGTGVRDLTISGFWRGGSSPNAEDIDSMQVKLP